MKIDIVAERFSKLGKDEERASLPELAHYIATKRDLFFLERELLQDIAGARLRGQRSESNVTGNARSHPSHRPHPVLST